MSTANFRTQSDFPLFVKEDMLIKLCPECHCANDADANECVECGRPLSDVPSYDDVVGMEDWKRDLDNALDALNHRLRFYRVVTLSGYYTGMQLFVERTDADDPRDLDNADTHYLYDCCRSKAVRMIEREEARTVREMRKIAQSLDMMELICFAHSSNGEAFYQEASRKQPKQMPARTHEAEVA